LHVITAITAPPSVRRTSLENAFTMFCRRHLKVPRRTSIAPTFSLICL
jgi:hypothetical protein